MSRPGPLLKNATTRQGAAMVVVLWVILVLSLLISGFAFTMHVETQIASFARKELKAEMLARSGIEVARMQLILDTRSPTEAAFDALNQLWATNELLYVEHALGEGKFNVKVSDEESKIPINRATPQQLKRLMILLQIDPFDADVIVDSIIDWMDENDLHQLNGAEDDYYRSLSPPYSAKNGPLDRVEELLLVRGVTPEIFYGAPATEDEQALPGLAELLTTTSSGRVNINTASPIVLQALLGLDDLQVEAILNRRDGADGIAGTEDDQPFRSAEEFYAMLGGLDEKIRQQVAELISINSTFFTVKSTGEYAGVKRTILATLRREAGNVHTVTWRQLRGGS